MDRRALIVEVSAFGIGSNQPVVVSRLEFVTILHQNFLIADTLMASPCLENGTEGEGTQSCVATGASPSDHQSVRVYQSTLYEVTSAIHAVIHVNDTPLAFASLPVGATITGAATVIHIKHRDTMARPVLNFQVKFAAGCCGGATMTFDRQRWK